MTHAEACICLYRPVVVVPAFAGGRKCGGACQPVGAGGSAPLFVPRGGNRLVAEGGESRHQRIYKSSCPPRIGARRRFLALPPRLAAAEQGKMSNSKHASLLPLFGSNRKAFGVLERHLAVLWRAPKIHLWRADLEG